MIRDITPTEEYHLGHHKVLVKREDLCTEGDHAPPFSKMRGVYEHLQALKAAGSMVVGYTETSISMAGWGVAWACHLLNMTAVIFYPIYKSTRPDLELLEKHREKWERFGAGIYPILAGRAKVNWYISKKILARDFGPEAVMLPLGLPFRETVEQTARQLRIGVRHDFRSLVCCVGSGTICAGLLRGMIPGYGRLYGIMSREGDPKRKKREIENKAGQLIPMSGPLKVISPGWRYTQRSRVECPFPCHPYYDLKAWQWLKENITEVKGPVLFWNIGRSV